MKKREKGKLKLKILMFFFFNSQFSKNIAIYLKIKMIAKMYGNKMKMNFTIKMSNILILNYFINLEMM